MSAVSPREIEEAIKKVNETTVKEVSQGEQNMKQFWDGVYTPNKSPRCKKLKKKLEENGHTNVYVWYERLGVAMEMCGESGGYMYASDQSTLEPIGYSYDEAMEMLDNDWHKIIESKSCFIERRSI